MEEQHFSPQHSQHPQQHWSQPESQPEPMPMTPLTPVDANRDPLRPTPVVQVLSPVGVEYAFLTISLFIGAGALMGALLVLVNGVFNFAALSFPIAALIITVPVFAFLFLRLKKKELQNPQQKLDPSKRRWTQFTQIVAFIVALLTLVGMAFSILSKIGGGGGLSIGKTLLNGLCILVVSGGILAYYWLDEHRGR
jgi:hypothetical protein